MPSVDIRLSAYVCSSIKEYEEYPERWENMAEEELTNKIALSLARDRAETVKTSDMYEKRVDLYVATPDIFWKIVNEEAEKIAMKYIGCKIIL